MKILAALTISLTFLFSGSIAFSSEPSLVIKDPKLSSLKKAKKVGAGFFVASKSCEMYENPSKSSQVIIRLKKGNKIWLESFDRTWSKGKDRYGLSVFVKKSCFTS